MLDKAAKAREMFAAGYTIHQVAERLGVEFKTARGWKNEMDAANKTREISQVPATPAEDPGKDEESNERFELDLPTRMMDPLFSTFTNEEKGLAIATVLQQRLDKAIEAFDTTGEGADDGKTEGVAA